ncbi:hypothetical protein HII36_02540 [Nonomuraea sp. NN258]|uniref:hypothetical protein n=1 Tax=Nonomuraea antri TaxID=2730852 RepID=UPI00156A1F03|nr:hypothetical protein [Nonomuraea antri]NRQ30716.1 hypothetical protein [Nonomuraea antri]
MTLLTLGLVLCTALSGCGSDPVDLTPLPADPPAPSPGAYICDREDGGVPARAVELMTGLSTYEMDVHGYFDLGPTPAFLANLCKVRDGRNPAQEDVLEIYVAEVGEGWKDAVMDRRLRTGGTPMPELLPGAIGVYWTGPSPEAGEENPSGEARAYLFKDRFEVAVRLKRGVPGRDSAADVLALMKLIAPTLMPRR